MECAVELQHLFLFLIWAMQKNSLITPRNITEFSVFWEMSKEEHTSAENSTFG